MEVVSFRAKKSFCFVKAIYIDMFTFYYHSRLVGQRPFLPLECRPHTLCPLLEEEYPSPGGAKRKDGSNSISITLLFRSF